MAFPSSPPKSPPPRSSGPKPGNGTTVSEPVRQLPVSRGVNAATHKVVVYGPGGIGKSELCSLLKTVGVEPLFLDVEDGTRFLDVARVCPQSFDEVRAVLHDTALVQPFGAVIIDSLTKLEELAVEWTLANVPHEKGHTVKSVEGYGFGKGYQHVYETMLLILGDLDAVSRGGRFVLGICHECTEKVPNPEGDDWLQYQPRLQSPPKQGKVRERVAEWADHLIYIGWDKFVSKDGKAQGTGTRTIYPVGRPTHWAKSRTLSEPIPYLRGDSALWQKLLGRDANA